MVKARSTIGNRSKAAALCEKAASSSFYHESCGLPAHLYDYLSGLFAFFELNIRRFLLSRTSLRLVLLLSFSFMLCACQHEPDFPSTVDRNLYRRPREVPFRLAKYAAPENVERLVETGRKLFFDPRLSGSGLMSCATCHNPAFHWTDSLKSSIENQSRRTMSLYDVGWDKAFLWNGTIGTLSAQVAFPITAPTGMNADPRAVAAKLEKIPGYRDELRAIMKGVVRDPETISSASIFAPLEFFVASIRSPEAPFDRWVEGDTQALTASQKAGFVLFTGKARCSECHAGWRFSDGNMYDIGLKVDNKEGLAKTPSIAFTKAVGLRNIADRPPYTHRGDIETLEEMVEFYNRGGDEERPGKSDKIGRLNLTDNEKRQLVDFLRSLSGPVEPYPIPSLPR